MSEVMNAGNRIYHHLGDELSRKIFTARLMYSITGDGSFLREIVRMNSLGAQLIDRLEKVHSEGKEIVIYGAGNFGTMIHKAYGEYITCFVDRNAEAIAQNGSGVSKNVYPVSWLQSHTEAFVILSFPDSESGIAATESVVKWLIDIGIKQDNICKYAELNRDALKGQYFDLDELQFHDDDWFLDCGCLDFETSLQFLEIHNRKCGGKANIIAFEPSHEKCCQIKKNLSELPYNVNAQIVCAAVSDKNEKTELYVESDGSLAVWTVNAESKSKALFDAVRIDDVAAGKKVTFIKTDIEGGELEALKGARNTIKRCRPQLAISIYHKLEDIINLPKMLLEYCPDYKLYLRHYSLDSMETILYAVCPNEEDSLVCHEMRKQENIIREKVMLAKKHVLDMVVKAGMGHLSSAYSCAEIIATLYYAIMRIDPKKPDWENRDRFIMSKNHGSVMQYPILADLGFFDTAELQTFLSQDGSRLGSHSKINLEGIDFAGGSLGIGLGVAAGIAYSAKLDSKDYLTFCLLGDGELYEGSIWEAALFSSHYQLNNLIAIVDRNNLAIIDYTEKMLVLDPLNAKWKAFGWDVVLCNGHDIEELLHAFSSVRERASTKPLVIIADTIKGKGIEYIENSLNWHGASPKGDDISRAIDSLKLEALNYERN